MPPRTPRRPRRPRLRRAKVTRVAGVLELCEAGADEMAARMQEIVDHVQDEATIKAALPPLQEAIVRLFEAHGEGHWTPTKEKTTKRKRERGQRIEPMRASDRLYQSLIATPPFKGQIVRVTKNGTEMRLSSRYPEIVMQYRRGRLATEIDDQGRREAAKAVADALLR